MAGLIEGGRKFWTRAFDRQLILLLLSKYIIKTYFSLCQIFRQTAGYNHQRFIWTKSLQLYIHILYVQEVVTHFIKKLLYEMGHYFLGTQYMQWCGSAFIVCGSGSTKFDKCGSGSRTINYQIDFKPSFKKKKNIFKSVPKP